MKHFVLVIILLSAGFIYAQSNMGKSVPKFDPQANPTFELKKTIKLAKKENKRIILDVGGEWCIWCHRIDEFIAQNKEINEFMHKNFVVLKINYSKENKNEKFLSRFPKIEGYPHFFVLEKNGKLLHSQNTGLLEKGKSYDPEKMMDFLKEWSIKGKAGKKKVKL